MITTYIVFFISLWIHGCRSQCAKEKPFYMIEKRCASFTDVCVKKDYPPCESLLQACSQCPASNLTESALVNMLTILRDQLSTISYLEMRLNKFENLSIAMIILIAAILLLLIEMRFQISKRCCRRRENGTSHRIINNESTTLIPHAHQNGQFTDESQTAIQNPTNPIMESTSSFHTEAIVGQVHAQINNLRCRIDETNQTQQNIQNQIQIITEILSEASRNYHATALKNLKFNETIHQTLANIENQIKTITTTLSGAAAPSKQKNGDLSTNNSITVSINMRGFTNPIKIQINRDDNGVKIKQKICAQIMNTKSCDFKMMVLKLNNIPLDDNQYLVDKICSVDDSLYCDVIENLDTSEILVAMLQGDICLPEMITFKKSQTIEDLKSVLSKLTGVVADSLKLFRDSNEIKKLDDLDDYESLRIIKRHTGEITIKSIFDNIEEVLLSYSNVESVGDIKNKIAGSLGSHADDIILFCDNKNLNDDVFLFDIDIKQLQFCHLMPSSKLDDKRNTGIRGDLSEIFECRHPWTRKEVVLKKYESESMKILKENQKTTAFLNELITFQITKSQEGFVRLNGVFKGEGFYFIMMEKMEGSIKDYIAKNHPLSEEIIVKWAKQILSALKYLHNHYIIHRNIKPSNILLDKHGNIKLSGFGVAKYVHCGDKNSMIEGFQQSRVGTFRYMAPEVCHDENYGVQADVWSFGATMIEMATGKKPFDGKDEPKALIEIGSTKQIPFELDKTRSPKIKHFIDRCLIANPHIRATVDELLNHDFLHPK